MTDRDVSDDGSTETETNTFTVLFDEGMVFISLEIRLYFISVSIDEFHPDDLT